MYWYNICFFYLFNDSNAKQKAVDDQGNHHKQVEEVKFEEGWPDRQVVLNQQLSASGEKQVKYIKQQHRNNNRTDHDF